MKRRFVTMMMAAGIVSATVSNQALAAPAKSAATAPVANPYADAEFGMSFYKIVPGKQDEWLALFNKWHRKVMQNSIDQGEMLSMTVYETKGHKRNGWDFAITFYWPKNKKPLPVTGEALIKQIFGNSQDYINAENQRWAITAEHWDEGFTPVDLDKKPLTIMLP